MTQIASPVLFKNYRIAVLMGGPGEEHDVSLASGEAVISMLHREGIEPVVCEVRGEEEVLHELPSDIDFVFNMIHGVLGEDGSLQELLDRRGIIYSGAGATASRLAFHKRLAKEAFIAAGVPTPPYEVLHKGEQPSLPFPCVIKPSCQGSAIGVHILREENQQLLKKALGDAFLHGKELLVEPFIEGKELTVGVLGDQALPVIEICPKEGFYDYQHKYTPGRTEYLVPAPLPEELYQKVQKVALGAHHALGLSVYSRADILLSQEGEIFVLEVNTIPGMTETSLLPKAALKAGLDFATLCATIMKLSLEK
jgi:D-alanine-D-alanine ligase